MTPAQQARLDVIAEVLPRPHTRVTVPEGTGLVWTDTTGRDDVVLTVASDGGLVLLGTVTTGRWSAPPDEDSDRILTAALQLLERLGVPT